MGITRAGDGRRGERVHFLILWRVSTLDPTFELFTNQAEAQLCFASVTGGDGSTWKKVSQKCQFYLEGYVVHVAMEAK